MHDSDFGHDHPRNGAMSLSCPERIAAAIPTEVRASRIARARTFAAVHESGSGPSQKLPRPICGSAYYGWVVDGFPLFTRVHNLNFDHDRVAMVAPPEKNATA